MAVFFYFQVSFFCSSLLFSTKNWISCSKTFI